MKLFHIQIHIYLFYKLRIWFCVLTKTSILFAQSIVREHNVIQPCRVKCTLLDIYPF